ncbi:MAG: DUF1553 domain-containing protein, partial [Saprospiraceae bacterium]|nr:DUF1553 domain-containing protein [Saprospiraceae bacterium]
AKCHDHKFDPLSQKEYYELYSFFNNINEAGQISFNNAMPVPTLLLTDEKQDSIIEYLSVEVKKEQRRIGHLEDSLQESAKKWIDDQAFHKLKMADFKSRAAGHYPLDGHLKNVVNRKIEGKMARTNSSDEKPVFSEGYQGRGLLLDGDAWLDLGGVGAFDRFEPFSVSLFLKLPKDLKDGVILHRGIGAVLYNFRGFHLALKDRKLEVLMAHTAPDNAILRIVDQEIPRDEWMHLVLKYDGSGRAQGLAVYLNGSELEARTETDNLYKTLNFTTDRKNEPGIQIGARWRGKGIGGAVVDDISVFSRSLTDLEILSLYNPQRVRDLLGKKSGELNADERRLLTSYFIQIHPSTINEVKRVYSLRQQLCHYTDTLNELMVFKEMEHRRPAFILDRGQYDSYKEEVLPRTPMAILAIDTSSVQPDRLDLAHWLFNDRHPLTARVFVNRIWQQFFGQGLVKTSEDFGNQGMMPSHPELLDYLAVYFRECDWDIKALIKLIVTSETYRQSSVASLHKREVDPENILLSRGPSKRLSAEMIRDQALAASGLLNEKIGGPSVFPYQPEGLWKVNGATYRESEGADLYRRSLYTIWKRSVPHPTQSTFDAPDRSECTMRRQQTNTPLQALVLMNDPIYIEASVALGRQIETDHNFDHVFRKLTGRKASVMENEALDKLWQDTFTAFSEDPDRCQGWLNKAGKMTEQDIMLAANSVVASTILNSDASIYKR